MASAVLILVIAQDAVAGSREFANAAESDPHRLMWMQGAPTPADKVVDASNWRDFPYKRWSHSHVRELFPTAEIWHGDKPATRFAYALRDLDSVGYTDTDGHSRTWSDMLSLTYTDGIVVLHKGKIVYEKYFAALEPHGKHVLNSVTKSFVGVIAATWASQGKLDLSALVSTYVPELKATAWGDATLQQTLDMTVGIDYSENYNDPNSGYNKFIRAGGFLSRDAGYSGPTTLDDFVVTLKKQGAHGEGFAYKSVNAQVMAWVLERVSGKSFTTIVSESIWQKLGAEDDAYCVVDRVGTAQASGWLSMTLRDLARFGEMMRNRGRFNSQQIIPASVVSDIEQGGDRALFVKGGYKTLPNWSYHNFWWVSDWGAYSARGTSGQAVYVDPKSELVIVRFASHPIPFNAANDPVSLPAYRAVAAYLNKH